MQHLENAGLLCFIFDHYVSRIQNWTVLKGFVIADAVGLGCKAMLCFPASHLEWVRGSRQWDCCFLLMFSPLAVIRAVTARKLVNTLGLVHTCHGVCEIRVSACMCKMHKVWIRQLNINMHMIKGCICVHMRAWSTPTFLSASFICVHVYVCVPECNREELWRVTLGLRKGHYYCL